MVYGICLSRNKKKSEITNWRWVDLCIDCDLMVTGNTKEIWQQQQVNLLLDYNSP